MEYIATYHTDVGTRKETNQDSLAIKVVNTKEGNVAFAIVCDGMGGLAKGEVASKEVIEAFCTWFDDTLVAYNQTPDAGYGQAPNQTYNQTPDGAPSVPYTPGQNTDNNPYS